MSSSIMGTYTPNLNLYKPAIGETDWGDKVNQNFDILDSEVSSKVSRPVKRNDLEYTTIDVPFMWLGILGKLDAVQYACTTNLITLTIDDLTDRKIRVRKHSMRWVDIVMRATYASGDYGDYYMAGCFDVTDTTYDFDHYLIKMLNDSSTVIASQLTKSGGMGELIVEQIAQVSGSNIKSGLLKSPRNRGSILSFTDAPHVISATDTDITQGGFGFTVAEATPHSLRSTNDYAVAPDYYSAWLLSPESRIPPAIAIAEIEMVEVEEYPRIKSLAPKTGENVGLFDWNTVGKNETPKPIAIVRSKVDNTMHKIATVRDTSRQHAKELLSEIKKRGHSYLVAGVDTLWYQIIGHEHIEPLSVADHIYDVVLQKEEKIRDPNFDIVLSIWKSKLARSSVTKTETEKHLKKLEEVEKKGW